MIRFSVAAEQNRNMPYDKPVPSPRTNSLRIKPNRISVISDDFFRALARRMCILNERRRECAIAKTNELWPEFEIPWNRWKEMTEYFCFQRAIDFFFLFFWRRRCRHFAFCPNTHISNTNTPTWDATKTTTRWTRVVQRSIEVNSIWKTKKPKNCRAFRPNSPSAWQWHKLNVWFEWMEWTSERI